MSSNVLLIRHGQVDSPMSPNGPLMYGSDQPLNRVGERQMANLGKALISHGVEPEIIYSSPFPRAIQSAQILSQELSTHPQVIIRDNLRGADCPQWEGRPVSELAHATEDIFSSNPNTPSLQGESLQDGYARVVHEYITILDENPGTTVAIVTHGEIISMMRHYGRTGDKNNPGLDQPVGKAEALMIQRNNEGAIAEQRLITSEFQPTPVEMKK